MTREESSLFSSQSGQVWAIILLYEAGMPPQFIIFLVVLSKQRLQVVVYMWYLYHVEQIDAAATSSKQNGFFYDWWLRNALGWMTMKCLGPDVWSPQSQKSDCLKTQSPNPDCFKTQSKKNRPRTEGQSQTIRKVLFRRNTVPSKI